MQIDLIYQNSITKKIIDFLFVTKESVEIDKTIVAKIIDKFSMPFVGEALIVLSVLFSWYEPMFNKIGFPSFTSSILLGLSFILIRKKYFKFEKIDIWLILFYIVLAISGIGAIIFLKLQSQMILMGTFLFLQFGLAYFIGKCFPDREVVYKSLILLGIPLALYGLYQYILGVPTPATWLSAGEAAKTRAFGFFGSPNVLGAVLAMLGMISIGFMLKEKRKRYIFSSIIFLSVLVLTFSRSAWLGFLIAFFVGALLYNYKYLIFALFAPLLLFVSSVRDRISSSIRPEYYIDSMLDGRIWSAINGFHIFKSHYILGTGPGSYGGLLAINSASPVYLWGIQNGYTALYYTDNQWIQLLVQTGIFGFILFLLFILGFIYLQVRVYLKQRNLIDLAILTSLISILVISWFSNILEFSAIAVPFGIMLGASKNG